MKTLKELIQQEQERGRNEFAKIFEEFDYIMEGGQGKVMGNLLNDLIASSMTTTAKAVGEEVEQKINATGAVISQLEDREGKLSISFENLPGETKQLHIFFEDPRSALKTFLGEV